MTALLLAATGALGVHLLVSSLGPGRQGTHRDDSIRRATTLRRATTDWLTQAGLADVRWRDVGSVCLVLFALGALIAYAVFGGLAPSVVAGLTLATVPPLTYRRRRIRRLAAAQEAWPRMIEEIRVLTGHAGTSIPQALFQVGRRAPVELREAFDAAHREWLLTTDFERAVEVLQGRLAAIRPLLNPLTAEEQQTLADLMHKMLSCAETTDMEAYLKEYYDTILKRLRDMEADLDKDAKKKLPF